MKRIGNLEELAFHEFRRDDLSAEMWEWNIEESIRRYHPECFLRRDFKTLGYMIDMKTPRDVSAFLPGSFVE